MRIFSCILMICFISISTVFGNEDKSSVANVENLKILRKSVNFAFKIGNDFLDIIRGSTPTHEPMKQIFELGNKKESVKLNDIVPIFMPLIGYFVLLIIGFLFVVLMPIVGFCFCLCRCGGKCGGKVKGMDPKHATCKRYTYAVLLGMISVVMLAGIVLAFINNQLIHDTLTNQSKEINAIKQIKTSAEIMRSSLHNISIEISNVEKSPQNNDHHIDKAQFTSVLSNQFINKVESLNEKIKDSLKNIRTELSNMKENLQENQREFKLISYLHDTLKNNTDTLTATNMQQKINGCLKNFSSDFEELKGLMKNHAKPEFSTGTLLRVIVEEYNTTVLKNVNEEIERYSLMVKNEYLEYRMYICIGVCCLLLLIVLFYFLGLCFGQCGERPFEDARICNRGVGANLMMAGVAFAFLFTPSIMVITMMLFMSGGSSQTEVCRYLTNSYGNGVKSFDQTWNLHWNVIKEKLENQEKMAKVFESPFDSLINKCPTMSMAMAFNVHKDLLSQKISKKIEDIADKIKKTPKKEVSDSYLADVYNTLENIKKEVEKNRNEDKTITDRFRLISTKIADFLNMSYKTKILSFFDSNESNNLNSTLTYEVKSIFNKVYIGSYDSVKCVGMHNSTKMFIDAICVTFLWPFNGFWYGVGICLVFTIPAIIFAVKLAGLYRHTEKYSADYEEPDYHSYMGFYTNNADNIPMKKPKSGKNSQKNRNSSFNNKDSLKQTNPQYLPVYPYDAYE